MKINLITSIALLLSILRVEARLGGGLKTKTRHLVEQTNKIPIPRAADGIAVHGATMVVGASNLGATNDYGTAFVLTRPWTAPPVELVVVNPGRYTNDRFGYQVATFDDNLIVVGAPGSGDYNGAVYVFEKSAQQGTWQQTYYYQTTGLTGLGSSLAIGNDGKRIAVGGYLSQPVHIYEKDENSGQWSFTGTVGNSPGQYYGDFLAMKPIDYGGNDGVLETLVISDVSDNNWSGVLFVYRLEDSQAGEKVWNLYMTVSDPSSRGKQFGNGLAFAGKTIVAGTYNWGAEPGMVVMFEFDSLAGSWGSTPTEHLSDSALNWSESYYGVSRVAAIDDTILVGAVAENAFYVLEKESGQWLFSERVIPGDVIFNNFGRSITMHQGDMFATAFQTPDDWQGEGWVYVYSEADSDSDGMSNFHDLCEGTADNMVVNQDGCSIDQLCPCKQTLDGKSWKNHDHYVSCVTSTSMEFQELGLITETEKEETISRLSQSSCGSRQVGHVYKRLSKIKKRAQSWMKRLFGF